jgi:hypothetical protein
MCAAQPTRPNSCGVCNSNSQKLVPQSWERELLYEHAACVERVLGVCFGYEHAACVACALGTSVVRDVRV